MSATVSTTTVEPLVRAKTRAGHALSSTSTPTGSPKVQPTPSPGTWQHPKLQEITRRQAASRFSSRDFTIAGTNAAALLLSFYFYGWLHTSLSYAASPINDLYPASSLATSSLSLFWLGIFLNIFLTLRPLSPYFRKKDDLTDIPLTPSQRSLLGLPPSPSPAPGSAAYITPPRYRRSSGSSSFSSTPQSGRSISATYASSPLSTSRYTLGFSPGNSSPFRSTQRTASGSPFSYSPSASPLLHKAMGREVKEFNVSTAGFSPGLSRSQSVKERGGRDGSDSPSPSPGFGPVKRDPGLNYKWLYQRGRGLPKSESMDF
jgi:nucleoporin POM34